jgi:hypothetical protein
MQPTTRGCEAMESIKDMAKHALIIGAIAFLYMGVFGHGLPTKLRGPFFNSTNPVSHR